LSNPHAAPLPAAPYLAQRRKRAKELVKLVRAGSRVCYGCPRLANASNAELRSAKRRKRTTYGNDVGYSARSADTGSTRVARRAGR
jgi:hypothetical protein